jgi:hypothetical protein
MSIDITTLNTTNEYTISVISPVNALILNSGDEIVRPITELNSWSSVRIFWRWTLLNAPTGSNIAAGQIFAGLCSNNRSFSNAATQHCCGQIAGNFNSPIGGPQTFTGVTHPQTNPANKNIYFTYTLMSGIIVTGSVYRTAGNAGAIPVYGVDWSSHPSASMMGNMWEPMVLSIDKFPAATGWTATNIAGLGYDDDTWITQFNMSQICFRRTTQTTNVPTNISRQWQMYYMDNVPFNSAIVPTAGLRNQTNLLTADESLFGVMGNLNFFWKCGTPGVQLAIRDIIVVKMI